MRKKFCLLVAFLAFFTGCSRYTSGFTKTDNDILVSKDGVEYVMITGERNLDYLGELEFVSGVKGERKNSSHKGMAYQTGLFAIKESENDNILIRREPNNEWFSIYRKKSLPQVDFSVENCVRLEFVFGIGDTKEDVIHTTCSDGISDPAEIERFLTEIYSQKNPKEAGLFDLIKQPDGRLTNCYLYGVIYGFFEEEPNLVLKMEVCSYNDLAYSVNIEDQEYVLPETWLQILQDA